MTNPVFNINYQRAYSVKVEFITQVNGKTKGREQRYPKITYPKRTFTLKFDKNSNARAQLEAFFDSCKGNFGLFDWTWETSKGGNGQVYQCNFDLESLEQNINHFGYSECELKLVTIDRYPVTPPANFDFYYKTDYKYSRLFNNLIDKVLTAQNNRRAYLDTPKKSWTLCFDKNPETKAQIEAFFISKRGKFRSFDWTWDSSKGGDGKTYRVRFDTDILDMEIFNGYAENIQLPIIEVWPTPAPSSELEKDEIIPRKLLKIDLPTGPIKILDNETLAALSYNNEDYLGAPLELSDIEKDDNSEVHKLKVSISNVGQAISGVIGQHGDVITNAEAYISQIFLNVNTNEILPTAQLCFQGKANNLNITDEIASVDIDMPLGGHESKIPKMNYNTNCSYRKFKDIRCGYTGAEKTCDRTLETCKRYGNHHNFGGFPQMFKNQTIRA